METQEQQTDRRLHIAMVTRATTQHGMGGMELHAEALRQGLVANGHRVTTISTRLSTGPAVSEDQWGKLYFVGDGAPGEYSVEWWQESVRALRQIHANDPIDVIASQSKAARAYLDARSSLSATEHLPTVVITHSVSIDELRAHLKQIYRHPARAILRWIPRDITNWRDDRRWLYLADYVTVLSQDAARSMARWLRVASSQVTVIPNGIDVERIAAAAVHRGAMRQKMGIADQDVAILIPASLVRRKGHHYMLRALAFPLLRKYGRSLRLILAGEGPMRERLQQQCTRLGLTEQVVFAGRIPHEEIPAMLSAADIVALPSDDEGMPLSLLEAMAAGLPVVATRVGAIPEIIEDGEMGLLVRPGSPHALAQAIDELLRDPETARRLSASGREQVLARYDQRIMVAGYERVLRDAVVSGSQPDRVVSS
ncbi:MAG TPA: glycosyltransferase family 4 protein [Ktedonobacterales bacterium]|nr:glycosyltransferase family 4 protein [Ktedonobacterales bacterium]